MATLVYWQRKEQRKDEFDTLDEAVDAAATGVAYEWFAPEEIRDGDQTIRGTELDRLVRQRERQAFGY